MKLGLFVLITSQAEQKPMKYDLFSGARRDVINKMSERKSKSFSQVYCSLKKGLRYLNGIKKDIQAFALQNKTSYWFLHETQH